jgi:hypothetical protein
LGEGTTGEGKGDDDEVTTIQEVEGVDMKDAAQQSRGATWQPSVEAT